MNEPIGCTLCGGNDHNADECKRFAGEREQDRGWPDRDYWCKCCGCGEMFTGHKRQVICRVCTEESAAQPAPVVPEGLPSVLDEYERQTKQLPVGHERPERGCSTYNWRMSVIRDLRAMLKAAAPAQGQQVGCQECERMARQVKHWQDLAVANRKVADDALAELAASDQALRESRANDMTTMATLADVRAELSALKAQQVGQEPVAWRMWNGKTWRFCYSDLHGKRGWEALYTEPQPAPAQDVAGWIPVTERLPEVETDVLVRGVRRNEVMHRVAGLFNGEWSSQETEDLLLGEVTHWMPLPAAPAHDKQSGEVKP